MLILICSGRDSGRSEHILGIIRRTRHSDHSKTGLYTDYPEWVNRRAKETRIVEIKLVIAIIKK